MIELRDNELKISFPEVHPAARMSINFQRTLRIPDDGRTYPLPPGLGRFPLAHVDDHADQVPSSWLERGGVMLPMYQSEAMWICFDGNRHYGSSAIYPFAIKIATGKICAVSGETWTDGLRREPQNYVVVPEQPWLDGYCVEKDVIRQFVAMPLGAGYTAEEQLTGEGEFGGIQSQVYPMKRAAYERRYARRGDEVYEIDCLSVGCSDFSATMGLSPGGRMRQEIYPDPFDSDEWDLTNTSRCFVHLANSMVWQSITGGEPPHPAPTAKSYTEHDLPWFDYYAEKPKTLQGSDTLQKLKSVADRGREKGDAPLPENESCLVTRIKTLRAKLRADQIREWEDDSCPF